MSKIFFLRHTALWVLALCTLISTAQAAPPLTAELQRVGPERRAAPQLFDVKLHWHGNGLLEGVLEATVREAGTVI